VFNFEAVIGELDSKVYSRHVELPLDITKVILDTGVKRWVASYNNIVIKSCALQSFGDGRYYLMLNKDEVKKMGTEIGSMINVNLKEDKSKYGMPLPAEMAELLKQDLEADKYFHGLTPGKQRSLLYIIGKPKGSETRLRKAIAICEYLKSSQGNLDFREMNQAIKDSRFKL